jgi:hypothetical protein
MHITSFSSAIFHLTLHTRKSKRIQRLREILMLKNYISYLILCSCSKISCEIKLILHCIEIQDSYFFFHSRLLGLGHVFQFFWSYTVGRTPLTGDRTVARPLPTHRTQTTESTHRTPTSLPWVWFEPTIPAFERAKAVHALDRAATVIGDIRLTIYILLVLTTPLCLNISYVTVEVKLKTHRQGKEEAKIFGTDSNTLHLKFRLPLSSIVSL